MNAKGGRGAWNELGGWDPNIYTLLCIKEITMRTYCIAQELYSVLCGDLNRKEITNRGDIGTYIYTVDSRGCTVETNAMV